MHKTARLPVPNSDGDTVVIRYGLQWLHGNAKPYFSVTVDGRDKHNRESFGGCCHDIVLKVRPDMADLVALHLSDIDGQPMHALENGFFHLTGGRPMEPIVYSASENWNPGCILPRMTWIHDKRDVRPDYAKSHWRITDDELQLVTQMLGIFYSPTAGFLSKHNAAEAKARVGVWVEAQRARWKAEADAAIAKHNIERPTQPE